MSLEHLVLLERNCFKDERTKGKERGQKMDVCQKDMHKYGIQKNGTDEPICRAGTETQTQRMDLGTQ